MVRNLSRPIQIPFAFKTNFMRTIFILTLAIITCQLNGQELKRRAALGIRMQNMNDSLKKLTNFKEAGGAYIDLVLPGSTVDQAGMKPGAVLTKINGNKINTIRDIGPAAGTLRDGDPIEISYFQKGKTITKKVKAVGRPHEQIEGADMLYDVVELPGHKLRSILATPKGIENPPVVYFIQGYTCSSTEFAMVPDITSMKLYTDWIKAGYAVYRVEKAGIGDSQSEKHCMEMNFSEELEIFRQAYKSLQKYEQVNTEKIFIFGHSMGGVIAPILAKEFNSFGVMTYGTLIHSWFEYMQELTRVQGEMFNTPYAEVEGDIRRVTPFWYDYYIRGLSKEELLANEKHYKMLEDEGTLEQFKNGVFMDRHYTFWQDLQQVSLVNEWLQVKSHTLAIYGEYDIQALNANHVKSIARIVNSNNPGKGSWKVIKNADHGFVTFNSMEENVQTLNSRGYFQALTSKYNPEVGKTTIDWMNSLK